MVGRVLSGEHGVPVVRQQDRLARVIGRDHREQLARRRARRTVDGDRAEALEELPVAGAVRDRDYSARGLLEPMRARDDLLVHVGDLERLDDAARAPERDGTIRLVGVHVDP